MKDKNPRKAGDVLKDRELPKHGPPWRIKKIIDIRKMKKKWRITAVILFAIAGISTIFAYYYAALFQPHLSIPTSSQSLTPTTTPIPSAREQDIFFTYSLIRDILYFLLWYFLYLLLRGILYLFSTAWLFFLWYIIPFITILFLYDNEFSVIIEKIRKSLEEVEGKRKKILIITAITSLYQLALKKRVDRIKEKGFFKLVGNRAIPFFILLIFIYLLRIMYDNHFIWTIDIGMIFFNFIVFYFILEKDRITKTKRYKIFWYLSPIGFYYFLENSIPIEKLLSHQNFLYKLIGLIWILYILLPLSFPYYDLLKSYSDSMKKRKFVKYIYFMVFILIFFSFIFGYIYSKCSCISNGETFIKSGSIDYWYFSILTIMTFGYGDLYPVGIGRFWAILEGFFGYFFLALSIGLIVNMIWYYTKPQRKEKR